MQAVLNDPLALGMLVFGVLLNLAALGMRWEKERLARSEEDQVE